MPGFLTQDQAALAAEIGSLLTDRGETIAVAESTTGGLISAALLSVAGASRYFAGGGVVYTLRSRTELAGVPAEQYANYRGTTEEMLAALADSIRARLGATWGIAESGLAGPTGGRTALAGSTLIAVRGAVNRAERYETGHGERERNMVEFTTRSLQVLRDAVREASPR
jgi:PncC family amidohydrolase